MKKHLRVLLCMVLVLCALQFSVLAAQPEPLEIVGSEVSPASSEITVSVVVTEEITDGVFNFTYDAGKLALLEVSSPDTDAAVINGPAGVPGTSMGANLEEGNIRISFVFDEGSRKEDTVLLCRFELLASSRNLFFAVKEAILHSGDQTIACDDQNIAVFLPDDSGESGNVRQDETAYAITVESTANGGVTADRETAATGTTVTLTVSPDKGYTLETISVIDISGEEIKLTDQGSGKYTFTMPASNVTVKATFAETGTVNPFKDVSGDAYYYDAVLWAVENGVTTGTSATTFSPDSGCTRAQAVAFLWRAAGSPTPKSSTMPFEDVAADAYYHDAVLWAVENGITNGTSDTTFSPDDNCTRAQIVTFLWRAQGAPAADTVNPFTDVAADTYYTGAVLWAVKNGITEGTSSTTFSPDDDCTRAQIVTFLYRCMGR